MLLQELQWGVMLLGYSVSGQRTKSEIFRKKHGILLRTNYISNVDITKSSERDILVFMLFRLMVLQCLALLRISKRIKVLQGHWTE